MLRIQSVSALILASVLSTSPVLAQSFDEADFGEQSTSGQTLNQGYSQNYSGGNCTNSMVENVDCSINTIRNGINLIQQIGNMLGIGGSNNQQVRTPSQPRHEETEYQNQEPIEEISQEEDYSDHACTPGALAIILPNGEVIDCPE